MTILQEIHTWSAKLPEWQQDAIRRLYNQRSLTNQDIDDLYAMAKAEQKIADPSNRKPSKLLSSAIAAPVVPNRLVQITSIRDLVNVNALAEGQKLPISLTGLTIVYGENGSGKSGYSRVLKKACRARDQSESILQDARKPKGSLGVPTAQFDLCIDGLDQHLEWKGDAASPEQLSELAVFDSHCARAYVDNQGDFAYVPYGLDILEGLATACATVKNLAKKELAANEPNFEPLSNLAKTNTEVGNLLNELSADTKPDEIEKLANVTEADTARLAELNTMLAEADPKKKIQTLRQAASRFNGLAGRINTALEIVNDAKLKELQVLVTKSNDAKKAAQIASDEFEKRASGMLPGTGSEPWKVLFEAARQFAIVSHATSEFPNLPSDTPCPLCQNQLGDEGAARLIAFEKFIRQKAGKNAQDSKAVAAVAYRKIDSAMLDLLIDEALDGELKDAFPENHVKFTDFQLALQDRREESRKAAASKLAWESVSSLPESPSRLLVDKAEQLLKEAKSLEEALDAKAKAVMVVEQIELDARSKLAKLKGTALEVIAKLALNAKLQSCIDGISTAKISRKSTSLSESMATENVANALNDELRALNVHELKIVMKAGTAGGKAQYKLALQLPGGASPSTVLSEGEQRAIAIASFLAEVKLGEGLGGVVFDDPVSSLDHRRRLHVAKRLVAEAKSRQVVVFTHDIYFLCILQQESDMANSPALTQCIGRGPAGFGVQADHLPFDTLSTSKRVKALRQLCDNLDKVYKSGDEAEATRLSREAYSHLRMAWERGVEEVLLGGTVTRFSEGISTLKLKEVVVEDADYQAVYNGMTKSSKYSGHDPATASQLATPHPDDLRDDIQKLEDWRASVENRKKSTRIRRG